MGEVDLYADVRVRDILFSYNSYRSSKIMQTNHKMSQSHMGKKFHIGKYGVWHHCDYLIK